MASRKVSRKNGSLLSAAIVILICAVWLIISSVSDNKAKPASAENSDVQVHFIDVGQGDAALITSGSEAMLIDTGERDDKNTLIHYLEDLNIKSLKYLVITHPHSDHMGEAGEVISEFETENIIMPKITGDAVPTSSIYRNFLKTVKNQGKKITAAKDGEFMLGDCEILTFTSKEEHENLNNYSVIVKVVHGSDSFLITGDCEKEEEREMIDRGADLSADVLKAGHHGSYTSSSAAFLNAVRPDYTVVSCGKGNKYGHPHEKTVKRLKKYASHYYCTADRGSIIFISDGKGLTVNTGR